MKYQAVTKEANKGPEQSLKGKVLGAIAFSLILVLLLSIYTIVQTDQKHVDQEVQKTIQGTLSLYKQHIENDAAQLSSLLESIVDDSELLEDLKHENRASLLNRTQPLFKILKEKYQITHFYFTNAEQVNIVRVHNPLRFGDTINRYTTQEAEKTAKLFYGLELGAYGMFTLRAVKPIFDEGELIGFVELGREIEHIVQDINDSLGVHLYVTLFKEMVEQNAWEDGMAQLGRTPNWEAYSHLILVQATNTQDKKNNDLFESHKVGSRNYQKGDTRKGMDKTLTVPTPLFDVSGREVGDLWLDMDFSETSKRAMENIITMASTGVILIVIILAFLYVILNQVQQAIYNYREKGLEDANHREMAKQVHLDEMIIKKAEVEELAERMSAVVDTAMDGIITLDVQGVILSFNKAASTIFGYSEEEITGKNINRLVPGSMFEEHEGSLINSSKTNKNNINDKGSELTGLHKDSREIPVYIAISEVTLHGKRSFTGVIHDISDRKRAEYAMQQRNEALEISNRELQDFAYVASHDLQEPLRKIRAFGDRLRSKITDRVDEKSLDYLTRMLNAAERMQVLISSLLSYSRVTSQAKPFKPVNLTEIVSGVISDLESRIEDTNTKIKIESLPVLEADSLQMRQLFQNLIGNAIKFQREDIPPVILIKAEKLPAKILEQKLVDFWKITIKDNGVGFEDKYAKRIFEVFERLHNRTNYEGTGIGLAVCRKIIERHHGSITAQSTPNEGTLFTIILAEQQVQKSSEDRLALLGEKSG